MEPIVTAHGTKVLPYKHQSLWRADHNGVHFVSQSWKGLVAALGQVNSLTVHPPTPYVRPETDVERIKRVLTDHVSSIWTKQAAFHEAKSYPELVDFIIRSAPSFNARNFARKLDKDFDDVTAEELTQHEYNLVRRNALIKELAERFQCR